jgi:hypothetical protein
VYFTRNCMRSCFEFYCLREYKTQKYFVARHKLFHRVFCFFFAAQRRKKFSRKTLTLFISLCLGFDSIICYSCYPSARAVYYIGEHIKPYFFPTFHFLVSSSIFEVFLKVKRDASVKRNRKISVNVVLIIRC